MKNIANYAFFLATEKQNYSDSEELYRKAIRIDPNQLPTLTSFTYTLLLAKNYVEAESIAASAWRLSKAEISNYTAYLLLFKCVISVYMNYDFKPVARRLKRCLVVGFESGDITYDGISNIFFDVIADKQNIKFDDDDIDKNDVLTLFKLMYEAVKLPETLETLDKNSLWQNIKPLDVDLSWCLSKPNDPLSIP